MDSRPVKLGKYVLYERLASGGMAEVYRASASGAGGFQKQLAIKQILPHYSNNEEFRSMFESEARICSSLTHGNIVQVYDFVKNGDTFLLAMEFVNGKNLRQFINKIKKLNIAIPLELSLYIINEVCKGLEYAHSKKDDVTGKPQNIIHRDISPQNIMLSYDGAVKIVDFGIAKAKDRVDETRAGVIKGKFGYMSPEQANGEIVDHRTDIFSTGIILWELLAGRRLFAAENDLATLKLIQECVIVKPSKVNPKIPGELEKLAMKALTKDLSLRYQSAGVFHRQLQEYLNRHYSSFTQREAADILQKSFVSEISSEKKRAEQFYNQPIPFSQGSQAAPSTGLDELEQALEGGSITKSEQGSLTAVTSEEELAPRSEGDSVVSVSSDKTVNADLLESKIDFSGTNQTGASQKTVISEADLDPLERMPSIAQVKAAELKAPKKLKAPPSEDSAPTMGKEPPSQVEPTSSAVPISLETEAKLELARRRERSISVISDISKQPPPPEGSYGRDDFTNNSQGKSSSQSLKLEEFNAPPTRAKAPTNQEEEDLFRPKKKRSGLLYGMIGSALVVTGYLFKILLNGDFIRYLPGPNEPRTPAENTTPSKTTPSGTLPGSENGYGDCQMKFDTDPPGADIFIDGVRRGSTTGPLTLPCGKTVNVRIEYQGFVPATRTVTVREKWQETEIIQLVRVKEGILVITVDTGVEVYVDGKDYGKLKANVPTEFKLSAQKHHFRFRSPAFGFDQEVDYEVIQDQKISKPTIKLNGAGNPKSRSRR